MIKCLSYNCQSIKGKEDGFKAYLLKHKIKLVFLQEWQVHNTIRNLQFFNLNYTVYNSMRTAILWHNDISCNINKLPYNLKEAGHYINVTRISMKNNVNIVAISYYRTGINYEAQLNELNYVLYDIQSRVYTKNSENYLLINGDFNCKHTLWYRPV